MTSSLLACLPPVIALAVVGTLVGCAQPRHPVPVPVSTPVQPVWAAPYRQCIDDAFFQHTSRLVETLAPEGQIVAAVEASCSRVVPESDTPTAAGQREVPRDTVLNGVHADLLARFAHAPPGGFPPVVPAAPPASGTAAGPVQMRMGADILCPSHPEYPAAAMRAGAMGETRLRLDLDASGEVQDAIVLRRSGPTREHRLMDRAAMDALMRCDFRQAHVGPGARQISYVWRLE